MSASRKGLDEIEFRKFKLNVELSDQQGLPWFLLSFAIVIYFWAAATPIVWETEIARSIVMIIFVAILLLGVSNYAVKRKSILERYERLCRK